MKIVSRTVATLTAVLTTTLAVATVAPAAQAVTGDTVVTVSDSVGDVANPGKIPAGEAGTVDLSKVTYRLDAAKTELRVRYVINGSGVNLKHRKMYGFEVADADGNLTEVWGAWQDTKVYVSTDGADRTRCKGGYVLADSDDLMRLKMPTTCLTDAGVSSGTLTGGAFIESIKTGADLASDTVKATGVLTLAD